MSTSKSSDGDSLTDFVTELLARLSSSLDESKGGTGFADIGISLEMAKRNKPDPILRLVIKGHPSKQYVLPLSQFQNWERT